MNFIPVIGRLLRLAIVSTQVPYNIFSKDVKESTEIALLRNMLL